MEVTFKPSVFLLVNTATNLNISRICGELFCPHVMRNSVLCIFIEITEFLGFFWRQNLGKNLIPEINVVKNHHKYLLKVRKTSNLPWIPKGQMFCECIGLFQMLSIITLYTTDNVNNHGELKSLSLDGEIQTI